MAFYILYVLIWLTLTSIPFYFYRTCEILFDSQWTFFYHDFINSSTFTQLLLIGISVQPVLYTILFLPARYIIRWKSYTFVHFIPQQRQHSHPISQSKFFYRRHSHLISVFEKSNEIDEHSIRRG